MPVNFWTYSVLQLINKYGSYIRIFLLAGLIGDSSVADAFALANSTIALIRRIFTDGSFETMLVHSYMKSHDRPSFAKSILVNFGLFFSCVAVLVAVLTKPIAKILFVRIGISALFCKFLFWFSPLIVGFFLMSFCTSILNAHGRFGISTISPTVGNIFFVLLILIMPGKYKVTTLIVGSLLYAFIQVIFMFMFMRKNLAGGEVLVDDHQREFTKKSIIGALCQCGFPMSEMYIKSLFGKVGVGFLSRAEYGHKISAFIFAILVNVFSSVLTPKLSSIKNPVEFQQKSTDAFVLSHILVILPCLLVIFCSEQVAFAVFSKIKTFSDPKSVSIAISLIGVSIYFFIQNRILSTILITNNKANKNFMGTIIYIICTVICATIMHKSFTGIIWAGNFGVMLQFIYMVMISNLHFNFTHLLALISSSVLGGVVVYGIQHINIGALSYLGMFKLPLIILVLGGIYMIFLLVFWPMTKNLFKKEF